MRRYLLATCLALSACAATSSGSDATLAERSVVRNWRRVDPEEFATRLAAELAPDTPFGFAMSARKELSAALDEQDEDSVRAAVQLARSSDPADLSVLLERLERRVAAPTRARDAGDVVAAAALRGHGYERRLERLAVGRDVHPDLEVRVECAVVALAEGRTSVVPFLLRILRAGTPLEPDDPPDWERKPHMTWSKTRAAAALSARAGVPVTFRPDGSYAHQERETRRLEELLSGR